MKIKMKYPVNIEAEIAEAKKRNGPNFDGPAILVYQTILEASKEAYERGVKDGMAKAHREAKV